MHPETAMSHCAISPLDVQKIGEVVGQDNQHTESLKVCQH